MTEIEIAIIIEDVRGHQTVTSLSGPAETENVMAITTAITAPANAAQSTGVAAHRHHVGTGDGIGTSGTAIIDTTDVITGHIVQALPTR